MVHNFGHSTVQITENNNGNSIEANQLQRTPEVSQSSQDSGSAAWNGTVLNPFLDSGDWHYLFYFGTRINHLPWLQTPTSGVQWAEKMNNKALWLAKHWGLGIGVTMSLGGLIMAAPYNMQTWRISEVSNKDPFFKMAYTTTIITRLGEYVPIEYKTVGTIRDSHEMKGLGASMMILGTTLLFGCANSLKKEYERLERANWMVRQSEFELADLEYTQGVEVDRWAIELDAQQQISNMIQPPKSYYEKEDEQPKLKPEPEFSRNATGFLGWLMKKASERNNNNFEVRWCCQQTWSGQKSTKEEITAWVDELTQIEQTEWLDPEKKNFRLLND